MNKRTVEKMIPEACEVLTRVGIAKNGRVEGNYRAQFSAFGAAVTMGSVRAAVAFFNETGRSDVERFLIVEAVSALLGKSGDTASLTNEEKESIINAAVALKLALNFFTLDKSGKGTRGEEASS